METDFQITVMLAFTIVDSTLISNRKQNWGAPYFYFFFPKLFPAEYLWIINRLSVKRHSTTKTSTSTFLGPRNFQSGFRSSFWFNHFCGVLFPLRLPYM